MNELKQGFNIVPIEDVVSLVESGKLNPYLNNRGFQGISRKRVRGIADDFRPSSLGTIALTSNGSGNSYIQMDGHHRVGAIMLKHNEGTLSTFDYAQKVCLQYFPKKSEGMQAYADIGTAKGHTKGNKWTNEDYAIASLIKEIIGFSSLPRKYEWENIKAGFVTQMAYAIVTILENGGVVDYQQVFKARTESGYADIQGPGSLISLSNSNKMKLGVALVKFSELEALAHKLAPMKESGKKKLPDDSLKVLRSGTFFGFFLADYLSNNPKFVTPRILARVAENVIFNASNISHYVTNITTGNQEAQKINATTLVAALKRKN